MIVNRVRAVIPAANPRSTYAVLAYGNVPPSNVIHSDVPVSDAPTSDAHISNATAGSGPGIAPGSLAHFSALSWGGPDSGDGLYAMELYLYRLVAADVPFNVWYFDEHGHQWECFVGDIHNPETAGPDMANLAPDAKAPDTKAPDANPPDGPQQEERFSLSLPENH